MQFLNILFFYSENTTTPFVPSWKLQVEFTSNSGNTWAVNIGLGGMIDNVVLDAEYVIEDNVYLFDSSLFVQNLDEKIWPCINKEKD